MLNLHAIKKTKPNKYFYIMSNTIGIIVAALFFVITVDTIEQIQFIDPIVIAFLSLLAGLLVDRLNQSATSMRDMELTFDRYINVIENIDASFNIQKISRQSVVRSYFLERIPLAIMVRNTFIGSGYPVSDEEAAGKDIVDFYEKFFENKGGKWIDAVGMNELSGPRFKALKRPKRESSRHMIFLMRHSMPVINFTLIKYEDKSFPQEVIFGWQYAEANSSDFLFKSDDQEIIEAFSDYFDALHKYALDEFDVDYTVTDQNKAARLVKNSNVVDRSGCWITIGYKGDRVNSIACFDLNFKRHQAYIFGQALWIDGLKNGDKYLGIEEMAHSDGKVSYTDNKVFLEYGGKGVNRWGICVYNFKKQHGEERVVGYLQEDGSPDRVQLIGFKANLDPKGVSVGYQEMIARNKSKIEKLIEYNELNINWEKLGLTQHRHQ